MAEGFILNRRPVFDPDALAYIKAVEDADQQILEPALRRVFNEFVKGCKNDGIWDAILSSCIMAGARTLSGALVPLKGDAPTNNNFVNNDYDRVSGLKGDGSTKFLDSNRLASDLPQNSAHISVFANNISLTGIDLYIGSGIASARGRSLIFHDGSLELRTTLHRSIILPTPPDQPQENSLIALARPNSSQQIDRVNQVNYTRPTSSEAPPNQNYFIYRVPPTGAFGAHRLAFYSIGEFLDLALLDNRVSKLMNDIQGSAT